MKINNKDGESANPNSNGEQQQVEFVMACMILSKYSTELNEVGKDGKKLGHEMVEAGIVGACIPRFFADGMIGFSKMLMPPVMEIVQRAFDSSEGGEVQIDITSIVHGIVATKKTKPDVKYAQFLKASMFVGKVSALTADAFSETVLGKAEEELNAKGSGKTEDASGGGSEPDGLTPAPHIHLN